MSYFHEAAVFFFGAAISVGVFQVLPIAVSAWKSHREKMAHLEKIVSRGIFTCSAAETTTNTTVCPPDPIKSLNDKIDLCESSRVLQHTQLVDLSGRTEHTERNILVMTSKINDHGDQLKRTSERLSFFEQSPKWPRPPGTQDEALSLLTSLSKRMDGVDIELIEKIRSANNENAKQIDTLQTQHDQVRDHVINIEHQFRKAFESQSGAIAKMVQHLVSSPAAPAKVAGKKRASHKPKEKHR